MGEESRVSVYSRYTLRDDLFGRSSGCPRVAGCRATELSYCGSKREIQIMHGASQDTIASASTSGARTVPRKSAPMRPWLVSPSSL